MDNTANKMLDGRYRIEKLLGAGGMANVYKATDMKENRPVAVKVLRAEFMNNADLVRRFKNESKRSCGSRLNGPRYRLRYSKGKAGRRRTRR